MGRGLLNLGVIASAKFPASAKIHGYTFSVKKGGHSFGEIPRFSKNSRLPFSFKKGGHSFGKIPRFGKNSRYHFSLKGIDSYLYIHITH